MQRQARPAITFPPDLVQRWKRRIIVHAKVEQAQQRRVAERLRPNVKNERDQRIELVLTEPHLDQLIHCRLEPVKIFAQDFFGTLRGHGLAPALHGVGRLVTLAGAVGRLPAHAITAGRDIALPFCAQFDDAAAGDAGGRLHDRCAEALVVTGALPFADILGEAFLEVQRGRAGEDVHPGVQCGAGAKTARAGENLLPLTILRGEQRLLGDQPVDTLEHRFARLELMLGDVARVDLGQHRDAVGRCQLLRDAQYARAAPLAGAVLRGTVHQVGRLAAAVDRYRHLPRLVADRRGVDVAGQHLVRAEPRRLSDEGTDAFEIYKLEFK